MNIVNMLATEDRDVLEAWCRSRTQTAFVGQPSPLRPARSLCRVLGQYLMYVIASDVATAPHLMLNGCWEMWVTQAIARHVKPGMRCMDVGASFGYYTLLLAELVGRAGSVMAWEPHPEVRSCLHETLRLNGLEYVVVNSKAASDQAGSSMLCQVGELDFGSGHVWHDWPEEDGSFGINVSPIDAYGERVDFIKLDVGGHEWKVWRGMQRTVERNHELQVMLQLYTDEREEPGAAELLVDIQNQGFRLGTVGHDGQIREISAAEAMIPDTGRTRMLWLGRTLPA